MSFSVLGTGSMVPRCCKTNEDLATFLDTSDEWIRTRTGIQERRVITDETVTSLAAEAARRALRDANVEPQELDYILCPTVGGDFLAPNLACMVQKEIGAGCPALDLNAGCSGFLYALDVAAALFGSGRVQKLLVVAAEGLSRVADWADRSTCVLFGDGAAAVVLGRGDDLLYLHLTAEGRSEPLYIPFPAGNSPFAVERPQRPSYIRMDGQEVYRFAVNAVCTGVQTALQATGLLPEQIGHLLLHQANQRIIDAACKKLGFRREQYPCNITKRGNTSAASIPLLFDECHQQGLFSPGEPIIMSGFGAGLTSGTAVLRWNRLKQS